MSTIAFPALPAQVIHASIPAWADSSDACDIWSVAEIGARYSNKYFVMIPPRAEGTSVSVKIDRGRTSVQGSRDERRRAWWATAAAGAVGRCEFACPTRDPVARVGRR